MRAKIIDVSRYQGNINWSAVAASGLAAVAMRCTVGDNYIDPNFVQNWSGAKNAGMKVTAYHVYTPDNNPGAQIDNFKAVMGNRSPDWPLVLDVELTRNQSNNVIAARLKECLDLVEVWQGKKAVIYTAKWFWDQYLRVGNTYPTWSSDYALWVAQYPYDPTPPDTVPDSVGPSAIPSGWNASGWKIWQWTARGIVPGITARVDLDFFNGTDAEFMAWATAGGVVPPPPPPPPPGGGIQLKVTAPVLNVRAGPGTQYADIGDLHAGDILSITNLGGNDIWVEFEPGKWAAFIYQGKKYMDIV